jgi:hypothetical protein
MRLPDKVISPYIPVKGGMRNDQESKMDRFVHPFAICH